MMKDSSSCAIYGIKDSQKCKAAYSLHCLCVRVIEVSPVKGLLISFHRTEMTFLI